MKKLFSFISVFALAATLGISTVSAQKTIITAEKLWSNPIANMTAVAEARQGTGYNGVVYVADKASHSVLAYSKVDGNVVQDTVITNPAIINTAIAVDDAGNIVLAESAAGGNWYDAPVQLLLVDVATKTLDTLAITAAGRTDFISAVGNVKSAEGGYVYLYSNSAKAQAIHIVNGIVESSAVLESSAAAASGGQVVYFGTPSAYVAQVRASALQFVGVEAVTLPDIYNSKLGLDVFTIAGKTIYAYNIKGAANYTSSFQLYNTTDAALVPDMNGATELFAVDATKTQSTSCANWLRATVIDENTAYVHQYCGSDGAAVWKVSAVVAATVTLNVNDEAMGTVEGAGDVAVGGNVTVKAIPNVGHSFVAWLNGTDTVATTAEYTFEVKEDVALTAHFQKEDDVKLTLAVNDATLGDITCPEGIVKGENTVAYGTKVALTAVPVEGATFLGWYAGEALYNAAYTIEVAVTADLALTANFVKVLNLEYELNGGVTNDNGWTSKGALMLEIQKDYNTAYSASLAVVKEENGIYYFNINGTWMTETEAQGQDATVGGFFQNKTWSADQKCGKLFLDIQKDKYAFLVELMDYFMGTSKAPAATPRTAIASMEASAADAYFRADVSGFMLNSPATEAYPYTCNWVQCGTPEAYVPVWKHAFANPTEIVAEVVLNMPYKEGSTFDGWYTNAEFTGERIVTVSPESVIEGGKLYAKWIEYIPTIKEVREMEDGTETKVKGVVNHVGGSTIYIEDASGFGMDIYMKNSGLTAGQEVLVKGKVNKSKGWPRLEGEAVVEAKEGKFYEPVEVTLLSDLVNDTVFKYYAKRVAISGLTISKYADNGDVYFTDGTNEVLGYYMKLDQTTFPVNKVVNINGAVAAWYGENFQFTGDVASVTLAPKGLVDTYAYPTRHEKYTLKNEWIYSTQHGNYKGNEPGPTDMVRGMVARDGKMYFAERRGQAPYEGYIGIVDGATGEKLEPIKIKGDHLFMRQDTTGAWSLACQYPFNDIKMDNAGNCLVGACLVSSKQNFFIYTVDLTTGEATELINENLLDNPDFAAAGIDFRFDAFGVSGDVKGNACIMAADSKDGWRVYRWLIKEGVVGKAEMITLKPTKENCIALAQDIAGVGTAPQIFPQDETGKYFYVDGSSTNPILFDESGTVIEDFIYCPTGRKVWNNEGDTIEMTATQPNGVCEFEVNGEYFVAMVAEYVTSSKSTKFALYKYDNEWRTFLEMEPLWYFPNDGMGSDQYQGRSAVPYVDVIDNTAHIYLYATNNGYAAYTLTVGDGGQSAVEDIEAVTVGAKKVVKNGQVYIIKNGVVYTLLGAEVK